MIDIDFELKSRAILPAKNGDKHQGLYSWNMGFYNQRTVNVTDQAAKKRWFTQQGGDEKNWEKARWFNQQRGSIQPKGNQQENLKQAPKKESIGKQTTHLLESDQHYWAIINFLASIFSDSSIQFQLPIKRAETVNELSYGSPICWAPDPGIHAF